MEKTLKEKTTSALIWSFIDKFGQQIIFLATGIVLGRKLSPDEYGLVGTLTFFIALSTIIIGSGYGRALINKADIKQEELSTVFFYNIGAGILLYLILFFCAPLISVFFKQPALTNLSRVLFVSILFISLTNVQDIYLLKKMDLNGMAKANILSLLPACIITAWAAFAGFGVWALVIQTVAMNFLKMIFYWYYSKWHPSLVFKLSILKEMFPFGIKVLLTNMINTIFNNIYFLLIGRIYNMTQLGYYTQANKYQEIPSNLISNTFRSVSTPLLSKLNNDNDRLKRVLSKLVKTIALTCFPILLGLILVSKPLFIVLITEKWLPSVPIFRILCVAGIFTVLNYVLQESILAKGKSGELLLVEIMKKVILVVLILITLNKGVLGLAIGWTVSAFLTLLLTIFLTNRIVRYSLVDLIKDCYPYFSLSLALCVTAYFLSLPITNNTVFLFTCISFVGVFYVLGCRLFKLEASEELFSWLEKKTAKRIL